MERYLKNLETVELQKAKQVIGQFITSCSHSMRGPLKSITGLVNLLQNNDHSHQDKAMFLNLIDSTVNKMEHTLDELEHFLENSKRDVTVRSIDCHELIHLILHQYEEELSTKHVKVKLDIEQTIPFYSDRPRLRVILSNILSNAIQFRDVNKKKQEIKISVRTTLQNCTLSITDNGIGIDSENHQDIFQLFFRATQRSSGTGIGLYVVNEAVQKIGGSIHIDSTPDKGSTFTVTLPNSAP